MKRSKPLRRTPLRPAPGQPPRGRKPIKRKKRPAGEFARIYGSKARVAWIKALGCVICGAVPADNAHTVGGGTGYKAGYETIVPLCREHHRAYDEHRLPETTRRFVQACAPTIERLWSGSQSNPEHISGPLGRVLANLFTDGGDAA